MQVAAPGSGGSNSAKLLAVAPHLEIDAKANELYVATATATSGVIVRDAAMRRVQSGVRYGAYARQWRQTHVQPAIAAVREHDHALVA